jgi:2-aminoadipate transaminase
VSQTQQQTIFSQRGRKSLGQPIGTLMSQAIRYPHLISLAAGFVDNATLPVEEVTMCMQRLMADTQRLRRGLQYDSTAGSQRLREAIAERFYRDYPQAKPSVERIIIGAGSNQLLHLLAETLFDPGDIVLAAAPTYFVYMGTLRAMGVRVVGVHADEKGMCLDSLQDELARIVDAGDASRVKAIYVVTDFDNPAGSSLSLERRQRLLELARRWRTENGPLVILSDNAYQPLCYDGQAEPPLLSLASDASEFVVELGTFSKSFSPGVRVGVFPDELVDHLLGVKSSVDFGSPHLSQLLMDEAIRSGTWDLHLPKLLNGYRTKRDAMLNALELHATSIPGVSWRHPHGGLYVWLDLPEQMDASEQGLLWSAATQEGVLYVPGHHCYPSEGQPIQFNSMRLSFGVLPAEKISDGVERLCRAIRQVIDTRSL